MSISNVNGALAAYQYAGKAQKISAKETAFTEKATETREADSTQELSEAEEMIAFKKEFYADLEKLRVDRTIANVAINISEQAFQNMKDDPEYREKVLSVIKRDLSASVAPAPDCSLLITVGATLKDYRADAWSVNNDSEFFARSQDSFYKKTSDKKDRQTESDERLRAQRKILEETMEARFWQQKLLSQHFDNKYPDRVFGLSGIQSGLLTQPKAIYAMAAYAASLTNYDF